MRIDEKLQFQQSKSVDMKARTATEIKPNVNKLNADSKGGAVPSAKDGVQLSSASQSVAMVKQALIDLPDTRQDRIAELKAQIESGTYSVSPEDIATKIVKTAYSDLF